MSAPVLVSEIDTVTKVKQMFRYAEPALTKNLQMGLVTQLFGKAIRLVEIVE